LDSIFAQNLHLGLLNLGHKLEFGRERVDLHLLAGRLGLLLCADLSWMLITGVSGCFSFLFITYIFFFLDSLVRVSLAFLFVFFSGGRGTGLGLGLLKLPIGRLGIFGVHGYMFLHEELKPII
jgi:hypothetical protein